MAEFLYRKNGGQVLGASIEVGAYANVNSTYFGVATDPSLPDGADLGVPKIFNAGTIRNAAPGEIAAFSSAEIADVNLQERDSAKAEIDTGKHSRIKLLRGLLTALLAEVNNIYASMPRPITSITRSGTTATASTPTAHGMSTGQSVAIFGAVQTQYNGVKSITVTGATTFTYGGVNGNPATPATGTIMYVLDAAAPPLQRTFAQAVTAIKNAIDGGAID